MFLKKLQKILFYLLLFLLPSNLGKHFILSSSYVSGILVDYLVPTLYLTDIIILLILFLSIPKLRNQELGIRNYGAVIFSYLILNCLFAPNRPAAFYKFFKLLEFSLLSIYIKSEINIKKDIRKIPLVLAASVIFQSALAIGQWFNQGSIFNNYLFFGEQPYTLSTPGIKKISFFGILKAPPLGTFSHPNVLAGFLVLTFPLILHLLPKRKLLFTVYPAPTPWCGVYGLLITISLFLTFSFPAWLAFGLMVLSFVLKSKKSNFIKLLIPLFLLCLCLIRNSQFAIRNSFDPTSLSRRQTLNQIAWKMFLNKPLTGVGLNNFTYAMEKYGHVVASVRFLQPVHNVYFLILAETGVIGFLIFLCLNFQLLKKVFKTKNFILHTSYFILLFLSFFDHYLFTTQQGLLLTFFLFSIYSNFANLVESDSTIEAKQ